MDQAEAVINKELTLTADVENEAADAEVVWASSDEKVATVADGKVTPVAEYTVKFTGHTDKAGNAFADKTNTVMLRPS